MKLGGILLLTIYISTLNVAYSFNLRSERKLSKLFKESTHTAGPIPDPSCKKGVMSPDMTVCCTDECGSCGNHELCNDAGKYHEVTGKLAGNCCKDRIMEKAVSCEKDHAPCVLPASYKEAISNYNYDRPNRHAGDDCNEAKDIARSGHALGIDKGHLQATLYLAQTKYKDAEKIAVKVSGLSMTKTLESESLEKKYKAKLAQATDKDKAEDPLSGLSQVMKWEDAVDDEEAEVRFYDMIHGNSKEVDDAARKGLQDEKELKAAVQKEMSHDLSAHQRKLDLLVDDADEVYAKAEELWKMWQDSGKDYSCGVPPDVNHASSQCKDGNTKYSRKCQVTCEVGYDGKGTSNRLRCNKQGKFGKQLYGEWQGLAACVGRSCGKSSPISKAKNVIQDIRYPHGASYVCYEGFSTNRKATGPKAFTVPCSATGLFENNASHVCKAIVCGEAPPLKNTHPIPGDFQYTEVATYKCLEGFTVDGTPGGLKSFQSSCQATGEFTEGYGCKPVRCGPSPIYDHTKLDPSEEGDQYFGANLMYTCHSGYTLDQNANGADHFTLVCQANGEFGVQGINGDAPLPKCGPVSAGMPPPINHGNLNPREMFYGQSAFVTADIGYSTSGNPNQGFSFTLTATAEGTFAGREKFVPVKCGKLSVEKAKTSFARDAVYGDLLNFECEKGYSTDTTAAEASTTFSVQCEADGSFSAVPDYGKCLNINDCADHTCGPHGECVDHLMNYTCSCQSGFEQTLDSETNELVCGNINDCGPEACGVGECKDLVNGYKCECPMGYEEVDEHGEDGKIDHTCNPVTCGTPSVVNFAATTPIEHQNEKSYYQDEVVYQCDEGHTLDGSSVGPNHFKIECLASKQFRPSPDDKACSPVKCDNVPKVNSATALAQHATFNETVRYVCDEGHTVDGTAGGDRGFTVTCQVTGRFGEPQACFPINCGEPDEIPNANRASGSVVYKESVEYECFSGFTLDGSRDGATKFKASCQDTGRMTKLEQCVAKMCGEPLTEINALYAWKKDEGVISYPHSSEVICRDGYTVGGEPGGKTSFIVNCLANGEFEQVDERACQPVKCGAPPRMSNATLLEITAPEPSKPGLTREVFYMTMGNSMPDLRQKAPKVTEHVTNIDVAGLSQDDHFALRFSGALMIKKAGDYHFQLTSDDGSILYINGNQVVNNDGLHGMTSKTGKVELGKGPQALVLEYFEKTGGAGINLKWKGPDAAGNGWKVVPQTALQTKGGNLNYEEKAVYKCLPGFTTGGEVDAPTTFNVECLPNGALSVPSPDMQCRNMDDCEKHTCGPKGRCIDLVGPAPAYTCECEFGFEIQTSQSGEKFCGNKDECEGQDCGVGVCKDLIGDYTCSCPSGFYVGQKAGSKTCIPVECSAETPSLTNGRMLSSHSGSVSFPTTLRYKCDTGYSIDGTVSESSRKFQSQCKADGELLGMKSCQKISCGTPHVLPFTKLVSPGTPRRSIEYGDGARYECFDGYTIGAKADGRTTFEVTCPDDGVLTAPEICEPVRCGLAPHVPKSRPGIAGDVSFGQELIYRCDIGYTLDSSLNGHTEFHRQCSKDASFSALDSPQPCKPISPGLAPTVSNADMTEYAGRPLESFPPRVFYPNGLEYRCKPGYSTNGALSGPTKVTVQVTSMGTFFPALPSECKKIVFTVRGRVKNARNGGWLAGVKVSVEGTNNIVTSSWGFFTVRNVPAGNLSLVYEKDGYIKITRPLTITGNVASGGVADISMSPKMDPDQWRAVVKWGRTPSDLDTYGSWAWSTVWWAGMRKSSMGLKGTLEVDQTNGYGPETLYLSRVGNCRGGSYYCDIKYRINDYTQSSSMRTSGAEVTLYNGDHVAGNFKISECAGSVTNRDNWWHVFTIDGSTNTLKWNCKAEALLQTPDAARADPVRQTALIDTPRLRIRRTHK